MRHFINRHRTEHFDGFDFDRENWTVRMTAPELNRESKRQLLVLRNEGRNRFRNIFTRQLFIYC